MCGDWLTNFGVTDQHLGRSVLYDRAAHSGRERQLSFSYWMCQEGQLEKLTKIIKDIRIFDNPNNLRG
jgi:hypothetical protein